MHVHYKSAADLFLDTDLYNAHSTAADVLFAGVPMVTMAGTRMSSRIAASITSAGLGARGGGLVMVARDLEDYYETALRLATSPYMYEKTRRQLIHARPTCALYNTPKWVREWERGIRMLWESRHGLRDRPADSDVEDDRTGRAAAAEHGGTSAPAPALAAVGFHVVVGRR